MVLIHRAVVLGLLLLAGCAQSLFDDNRGLGGTGPGSDGGSNMAPSSCPSPCLADAAADFNGTAGGAGSHWRYLDDHRNRTWTAMTSNAGAMAGADPANRITTCAAKSGAPACQMLPGALLVSSAGSVSAADPALEFKSPSERVVQLSVKAFVPSGTDQVIRIYRNSREDVLFTGTAFVGAILEHTITLDALTNDRFLVAVAPSNGGAADVGLHIYVNGTTATFPKACQIAVPFISVSGNTVDNLCGNDLTHVRYNETGSDTDTPPVLGLGPFSELGNAADITAGTYFRRSGTVDRSGDTTLQFWVRNRTPPVDDAVMFIFSDLDLDHAGGLDVGIASNPDRMFVQTCTTVTPTIVVDGYPTDYPTDGSWQFIRVVQNAGNVYLCLNGVRKTSFAAAAGTLRSTFSPLFGMGSFAFPAGARFDGLLDDVRLLNVALPCD